MSIYIGWLLMVFPFILLFVLITRNDGVFAALAIFASVAITGLIISLGVYMACGGLIQ